MIGIVDRFFWNNSKKIGSACMEEFMCGDFKLR